ncbi:MAG: carboxypeptidase regulatory-like domain-containing protein [Bryobacterales bacterium]|nr:carboxypeptidase regulatory-like domain-containing protein [Bryobacterales bacterium]
MKRKMFWLTLPVTVLLASCGGGAPEAKKAESSAPAAAAAPPVDAATAGSISGKVAFTGEKPTPKVLSMDATPACARMHKGPVYAEDVVLNGNGTLKNVLVYIKEGLPKGEYPTPTAPVKLDQTGCIYVPHVVAVMVNQPLEISNSDTTNHNIHPLPRVNREWNESQPPKGDVKVKTFPKEEMPPILFKCNVHPWMRAWVGVMSNPYFAVTGDDGTFTLKNVPPGEYTIEAWQERYGTQEIKVKVEPKQAQTADFSFKG